MPGRQKSDDDIVRSRYRRRDHGATQPELYSESRPEVLAQVDERQARVADFMRRRGITDLSRLRILDVGCGSGTELRRWAWWGVPVRNLFGIDLVEERVGRAREALPGADIRTGRAQAMPWADQSFDVVTQYMAFSSMPSAESRRVAALEMSRLLSAGGFILWYDFWTNPLNREVTPMRQADVRGLFAGFVMEVHRVTLAPPLSRATAGRLPVLASWLHRIPLFRTHYLVFMVRGDA